jgi:alkylation response protein AidB-like acyl-CoA dehydrogenase
MSLQAARVENPGDWRTILTEIGPRIAEEGARCEAAGDYVGANIRLLRERGFFGLAVPVELGGGGLGRTEHPVAAQAWRLRHQQAPVEPLLKRIAGERLQILSSGGSDWLLGSCAATKVDGGYRVSGQKVFASGAPTADLFMTTAVEQTPEGPTVIHIGLPMRSEGITILDTWNTMGMRGTASQTVKLDNVFVSDAAVSLRRPAGKWHPSMHVIVMMALPLIYSVYTGIAGLARDIAVGASKKRTDPSIAEQVGELETEWMATRIAHDSMVAFAETAQPGPQTTSTILAHRALVARSAIRTVELAMVAAGGASYFKSMGLEKLFRDIQGARFHPMPDGPQRRLAGRVALGLPIDD